MAKKKILVIDDEPDITMLMKARLEANGYEAVCAENGEEGLQKSKEMKPDLIILDVMMPVMDGFEFFKAIKSDKEQADIPILVLTARGGMKDTFDVLRADGFVAKPFNSDDLLEKIKFLLSKKILLLSDDSYVVDKVTKAFESEGYKTYCVKKEDELVLQTMKVKYEVIVVHLPSVVSTPESFASRVSPPKGRPENIIIYSDARVKGTEDNDTVVIDELRLNWKKYGFDSFFDARVTGENFGKFIKARVL